MQRRHATGRITIHVDSPRDLIHEATRIRILHGDKSIVYASALILQAGTTWNRVCIDAIDHPPRFPGQFQVFRSSLHAITMLQLACTFASVFTLPGPILWQTRTYLPIPGSFRMSAI